MKENLDCNWNPYSCQSLLGYGKAVHERSNCTCIYCGMGKDNPGFDSWRQLSVDHVIPTSSLGPGGWKKRIKECFPNIHPDSLKELSKRINEINLVSACNFCNSMTSRMKTECIDSIFPTETQPSVVSIDDPAIEKMLEALQEQVKLLISVKQKYVEDRIAKLKNVYNEEINP